MLLRRVLLNFQRMFCSLTRGKSLRMVKDSDTELFNTPNEDVVPSTPTIGGAERKD